MVSHDVVMDYTINLEKLCATQNFTPEQVVSAKLVFPRGAVPNSMLLWVRVDLTSKERKFITLPLVDFYKYVDLPESNIGGWMSGDRGSDYAGLDARYKVVDRGGEPEV